MTRSVGWCVLVVWLAGAAAWAQSGPLQWRLAGETKPCALAVATAAGPVAMKWSRVLDQLQGSGNGLQIACKESQRGGLGLIQLTARNTGAQQLRLQLAFATSLTVKAGAAYWDGGLDEQRVAEISMQPDRRAKAEAAEFVPLAAVATASDGAWLWGLTPDSLCSYWRPGLDVLPTEALSLQNVRLVLQPLAQETLTLCAGPAPGSQYGLMAAAWERYQQAFPSFFRPTPGVCDNIWGASAEYMAWCIPPSDVLRRLHVTWDWCYTPFKRTGDIAVRDDEWQYRPLATPVEGHSNSMFGSGAYPIATKSPAEFRADRQRYFDEWGLDGGLMFYNLVHWVEKQLAEGKFADSIVVDPGTQCELSSWCRYHDKEVLTTPLGGPYEARIVGDMTRLAQELPTPGFALDVFLNREHNYSDLVKSKPLPGRAWDERGVYQDVGIAMAGLADRLHAVKLKDRPFDRIALVGGNGTTGFHTDATLYEMTFYGQDRRRFPLWRSSMGQKPGVIWQGYDVPRILPNWAKMSRHDFIQALWGITDYVRLKCFQWGIFPTYSNIIGVDAFQRDMPLLVELVKRGWHPLAPVTVKRPEKAYAWPSRYGEGASNVIVVGSPNETPVAAEISIDGAALGAPGGCVYVERHDERVVVEQQVKSGRTTIRGALPRRDNLVLESVLALEGFAGTAEASLVRDLKGVSVTVVLTASGTTGRIKISPADLPGVVRQSLSMNGVPINETAPLMRGANTIRVQYASTRFHLATGALDAVPFFVAGEPRVAIVTATPTRRAEARVIRRLRMAFDYTARQVLQAKDPVAVPVVGTVEEAQGKVAIILEIGGKDNSGWWLSSDNAMLRLKASNEAEAIRATEALLEALDQRYPYVVPYRGGMTGMYQNVQETHRMIGKTLSQIMAEEGVQ